MLSVMTLEAESMCVVVYEDMGSVDCAGTRSYAIFHLFVCRVFGGGYRHRSAKPYYSPCCVQNVSFTACHKDVGTLSCVLGNFCLPVWLPSPLRSGAPSNNLYGQK